MKNVIEISNVSVVFNKNFKALDQVSAKLPKGRIIGLIGPSGAGKTTLMRGIVGRQKLTEGKIKVLSKEAGSKELREAVNYMTQETSVYSDLTVSENIRYFATMTGVERKKTDAIVKQLIKTVDLSEQTDQLVESLSGGQKQRVSLAVSLVGKAKLLVLDEPTIGLDPVLRDELWKLFRKLNQRGATLVLSSHAMDEAERCDLLLLLRNGEILAKGTPAELCEMTGTNSVEQSFLKLVRGDRL